MGRCKNRRSFLLITGFLLFLIKGGIGASSVFAAPNPDWMADLPPEFSETVSELLKHPTFVRRPKPQIVLIQPAFFKSLLQDWELAYRVASVLGVKGYQVNKGEKGWTVILGPQTTVHVFPVAHQASKEIFLVEGEHQGRVIRHIKLSAVLLVEYEPAAGDSSPETISSTTVYIKVEQFLLAALIKMTVPLVGEKIDRKLTSVLLDVHQTSRKIHEDPKAAWQAVERSPVFTSEEKEMLRRHLQSYPSS